MIPSHTGEKVNRECEWFKLSDLQVTSLKVWSLYILKSAENAGIRLELLSKIEKEPNTNIHDLVRVQNGSKFG